MAAFTDKSKAQLATLQPALANVLNLAKFWSEKVSSGIVDWQISQGARTIEEQQHAFDTKHSKVNPKDYPNPFDLYRHAKHVTGPGMNAARAADTFVPGQESGAYDKVALGHIMGFIVMAAAQLGVNVRWGADFDQDGRLLESGTFGDVPHIELD